QGDDRQHVLGHGAAWRSPAGRLRLDQGGDHRAHACRGGRERGGGDPGQRGRPRSRGYAAVRSLRCRVPRRGGRCPSGGPDRSGRRDRRPRSVPALRRGAVHHRRRVPHRRRRDGMSTTDGIRSDGIRSVTDPADLGVLEASALLHGRALSSAELTEACLARIEQRNGGPPTFEGAPDAVNAWVRLYPDLARESARAADERLTRGNAPALCGIPLGLKDLYGMEGRPLTASSRVLEGNVAGADAEMWARLRGQGMVALGHTHTHEFAAGGTTDQVGNPWALEQVAGGSSGGSAAALAAGMTPAALGSDTCGSLRIPAACCGISSIKPSHGRVPLDGVIPLAPSLDHAGPMARTIADCAALLGALAAGGAAITALAPPPAPIGELAIAARAGSAPLAGVTVALTDRSERIDLHPRAAAALDVARSACEAL